MNSYRIWSIVITIVSVCTLMGGWRGNLQAQERSIASPHAHVETIQNDTGFVYVLLNAGNGSANKIYGFALNAVTGQLTAIAGFPQDTGGTGDDTIGSTPALIAERLVYDPVLHRLYALNGNRSLSVFSVNAATGTITPASFSPLALGSESPACVAVHPTGSVVVVGQSTGLNGSGFLRSYVMSGDTPVLAGGEALNIGTTQPSSCAFSQDGRYFYTGGGDINNNLGGFAVDAVNGILTPLAGSPFDSGSAAPQAFVTDTSGRLFVAHAVIGNIGLRAYTTSAGIPAPVHGNPFSPTVLAGGGVLHPSGFYMLAYRGEVFGNGDGQIHVVHINGSGAETTLSAVNGSPFATGGKVSLSLALSGSGKLLLVANAASRNVTVFSVNAETGALIQLQIQASNTLGTLGRLNGIAFAPQIFSDYLPVIQR